MATTFQIGIGLQRYIAYEQEQLRLQAQAENANAVNTLVQAKGTPALPQYPFHSTTDSLLAAQLFGGRMELRKFDFNDFSNGENANLRGFARVTLVAVCASIPPDLQYYVVVGFNESPPVINNTTYEGFGFPIAFNVPFVISGRENIERLCLGMSNHTAVFALCEQ
jgi:hypothetical protein